LKLNFPNNDIKNIKVKVKNKILIIKVLGSCNGKHNPSKQNLTKKN
jgi:hypothetical protein